MKGNARAREVFEKLKQYKYVLLVALVGALLLLWPAGEDSRELVAAVPAEGSGEQETAALEEKLARALSQVEGAGEVTVVLTLSEGPRRILARDGSAQESSTVVLAKGAGSQEEVELQRMSPAYRGALVVAQGGGDPQVRLELAQAVSALTGLGMDRITICKRK